MLTTNQSAHFRGMRCFASQKAESREGSAEEPVSEMVERNFSATWDPTMQRFVLSEYFLRAAGLLPRWKFAHVNKGL